MMEFAVELPSIAYKQWRIEQLQVLVGKYFKSSKYNRVERALNSIERELETVHGDGVEAVREYIRTNRERLNALTI